MIEEEENGHEERAHEELGNDECDDGHGNDVDEREVEPKWDTDTDGEHVEMVSERDCEKWGVESAEVHRYAGDASEEGGAGSGAREMMSADDTSEDMPSGGQENDEDQDAPVPFQQTSHSNLTSILTAPTPALAFASILDGSEAPLVDGPPTRTGRKRKIREWGSECECGERVAEDL